MSDQPHEPHHPHDPYGRPYPSQDRYGQEHQPPHPYGRPYDAAWQPQHPNEPYTPAPRDPYAQTRDGRNWDDQAQQHQHPDPVAYAETAHLPAEQQAGYDDGNATLRHAVPQHVAAHHASAATPRPESGPPAAPPAAEPDALPLTPAQRARAEGRSPILAPGMQPALLTAGLAALLALTASLARPALAAVVVVLQAVTAAGWYRLNGMWPARQGIALAFAGGVATDLALLWTGREEAPTVVLGVLGVWFLLVLILQLRNHSSPDERLYALTAGVASTAFTVLAAGHLAAFAESPDTVVAGAAAVASAAVARALPLPSFVSPAVALIAATAAGAAVGGLTGLGMPGALLGAAAGACALTGLGVASYDYPSRFVHLTAGVALPLAMAAPAVYLLARALG